MTSSLASTPPTIPPTIRHLYFHIPFCPKLCPYCCFYVEVGSKNKTTAFLDALLAQVDQAKEQFSLLPETIYFGGGTPTALTTSQLDYLLSGLRSRLDLSQLAEWTFEANPATVPPEKARLLHQAGVSRISLGVQSWHDPLLKILGRSHSAAQSQKTFATLREAGFSNINLDLIFAIPTQTLPQWQASLAQSLALQPEHLSAYCLTYEQDTAYFRQLQLGTFHQNVDLDADLFEATIDTLSTAGFLHYEISNYSLPDRHSLHNFAYWKGHDYLGFGPSAFSTVGLHRWQSLPDTATFTAQILNRQSVSHFSESLSPSTRSAEILAFAIRTHHGVDPADLAPWPGAVAEFFALGFFEYHQNRIILTRRGKLMADAVAEAFL